MTLLHFMIFFFPIFSYYWYILANLMFMTLLLKFAMISDASSPACCQLFFLVLFSQNERVIDPHDLVDQPCGFQVWSV